MLRLADLSFFVHFFLSAHGSATEGATVSWPVLGWAGGCVGICAGFVGAGAGCFGAGGACVDTGAAWVGTATEEVDGMYARDVVATGGAAWLDEVLAKLSRYAGTVNIVVTRVLVAGWRTLVTVLTAVAWGADWGDADWGAASAGADADGAGMLVVAGDTFKDDVEWPAAAPPW